jgi:predicted dehydrogenase
MSRAPNPSRRHFLETAGLLGAGLIAGRSPAGEPPLAPPDRQPPGLALPEPAKKRAGWAVVGLGKLALEEIMPAFSQCRFARPAALVSGHRDKAERVAAAHGVDPKHLYDYKTYDQLADDSDVDIVYIALPNSMHAEYTIRALEAGKHVLCEKPMAASVAECERMIAAAKSAGRKLMVAYRLRYEPFNETVIQLCRDERLGKIRTFSASNCQQVEAPNIRLSKQLSGGPLGDIGIYCLNAARYVTGKEPIEATAFSYAPKDDPRFREVPATVGFLLRFPDGVTAQCDCSFDAAESRRYRVHCAEGFIDLDGAFGYRGQQLHVWQDNCRSQFEIQPVNHFSAEMDHFSECVLDDKPCRTPGEEGLADMRAIAAIEESARTGKAVKI